jgi:hypothetical protein
LDIYLTYYFRNIDTKTGDSIKLLTPGAQFTIWSRDEEKPFPILNDELDPDDLCHENDVTK